MQETDSTWIGFTCINIKLDYETLTTIQNNLSSEVISLKQILNLHPLLFSIILQQ